MAKYFRITPARLGLSYENLKERFQDLTEDERGLAGPCLGGWDNVKNIEKEIPGGHRWLVYPDWAQCVKQGGKNYLICLNCGEHSHL